MRRLRTAGRRGVVFLTLLAAALPPARAVDGLPPRSVDVVDGGFPLYQGGLAL